MAKDVTVEVKTGEFLAGKGVMTRWEHLRRPNHWLDSLFNGCAVAVPVRCEARGGRVPRSVVSRSTD
jgi:hypothetical protein